MSERPPIDTRMIRTRATGPEPCNTLVFLRCLHPGLGVGVPNDELTRSTIRLQTAFRPDGYAQAQYPWYRDNTLVSATASLKLINTTTDLSFLFAVDAITPVLSEVDGGLGFDLDLASWFQNDALFGAAELAMTVAITAYVLCYEPRSERPPSGSQRTNWAGAIRETPRWSLAKAAHGGS
jgi:hypothetical protein